MIRLIYALAIALIATQFAAGQYTEPVVLVQSANCPDGKCPLVTPVRSTIAAVVAPSRYGSYGQSTVVSSPSYGWTGSAATVTVYGSTGSSAIRSFATPVRSGLQAAASSIAQAKADRLAASGRLSHAGALAGRYEGVGFSSVSADDAIRNCCYWGRRRATSIGVARGASGWFAVVGYD